MQFISIRLLEGIVPYSSGVKESLHASKDGQLVQVTNLLKLLADLN